MSLESQQKTPSLEAGSEFDVGYRNLLWAVDAAEGDDPQSDSITDHGQVDADARKHELAPPSFYAKVKGGMSASQAAQEENLMELPSKLIELIRESDADVDRKEMLVRSVREAEVRLRNTFAGQLDGVIKPTFEETWETVTGEEEPPALSAFDGEIGATRDHMLTLLGQEGVHVTNPKTLRGRLMAWEDGHEHFGKGNEDAIAAIVRGDVQAYRDNMKELMRRVPALTAYADQLDRQQFNIRVLQDMSFDAGLSYIGGNDAQGELTGLSNFEWNAGRPATRTDIRYVGSHEFTHAANAFLMDLQRKEGRIGPESALLTMNSSRAANEEGLAQTMREMLYGGTVQGVIDAEGSEMGIVMLQDRLQDVARMYAALGWNRDFKNLPEEERRLKIRALIEEKLLQTEHIGHKYGGEKKLFWRQSPAGNMYAPAYYYGSRAYREAISNHGIEKTLAVGTHTEGVVDLQTFRKKVSRVLEGSLVE